MRPRRLRRGCTTQEEERACTAHHYHRQGGPQGRHQNEQHKDAHNQHDFGTDVYERTKDCAGEFQGHLLAVADELGRVVPEVEGKGQAQVAPDQVARKPGRSVLYHTGGDIGRQKLNDSPKDEEGDHCSYNGEKKGAFVQTSCEFTHVAYERKVYLPFGLATNPSSR